MWRRSGRRRVRKSEPVAPLRGRDWSRRPDVAVAQFDRPRGPVLTDARARRAFAVEREERPVTGAEDVAARPRQIVVAEGREWPAGVRALVDIARELPPARTTKPANSLLSTRKRKPLAPGSAISSRA